MRPVGKVVNRKTVLYSTTMASQTITPAPSRREARRQSRREAILDVAERSFLEHGYSCTTMTAIAGELGGSKGTLWSYFPSKDELFGAVLDRATEEFRAGLASTLTVGEMPEAALGGFCRQFVAKIVAPESIALHRLVVSESGRFPEVARIFWERGPRETQRLLAGFLEAAMDRGLLRRDDPLRAGRQLIALCMSGCHQRLLIGTQALASPADIEDDAQAALITFLRAYAT